MKRVLWVLVRFLRGSSFGFRTYSSYLSFFVVLRCKHNDYCRYEVPILSLNSTCYLPPLNHSSSQVKALPCLSLSLSLSVHHVTSVLRWSLSCEELARLATICVCVCLTTQPTSAHTREIITVLRCRFPLPFYFKNLVSGWSYEDRKIRPFLVLFIPSSFFLIIQPYFAFHLNGFASFFITISLLFLDVVAFGHFW